MCAFTLPSLDRLYFLLVFEVKNNIFCLPTSQGAPCLIGEQEPASNNLTQDVHLHLHQSKSTQNLQGQGLNRYSSTAHHCVPYQIQFFQFMSSR